MENEQSQAQPNSDMTPEEAKASLGIATYLQGQMMPQGEQEGQESEESQPEANMDRVESMIDQKLSQFKTELLSDLEKLDNEENSDTKDNI